MIERKELRAADSPLGNWYVPPAGQTSESIRARQLMRITSSNESKALIDGSLLMTEACVRAGADVLIGYPITPANLLYLYASRRYPTMLPAPDEITTLQWMSGYAAAGPMIQPSRAYLSGVRPRTFNSRNLGLGRT